MTNKHPCEWYIQMAEMYKKNYDDLVSKIHEKIEFWGARHPMVVKEFESLLDNEKL